MHYSVVYCTPFMLSISACLYAQINHAWHWWAGTFFSYTFSHNFQGLILVFEYAWFLLQDPKNACNHPALIDVAIKSYQTSGTQTTVFNALQFAIEYCDTTDTLKSVIISIIHKHHMCKLILIECKALKLLMICISKEILTMNGFMHCMCHGSTGSPSALSEEGSKGGVTVLGGSKVLARGTRSCT